ncbi:hypothetical protein [Nocardia sp. NBC_00511]|uniref:hypothetical protein n=1 Tax=Nocardia sp. NBC_00511 TaxID=2903591 RepID=UPI0030DF662C
MTDPTQSTPVVAQPLYPTSDPSSGYGVGQHYWTVPALPAPAAASTALKSFVALSDTAIQTAVDLLGRGLSQPPPQVSDLMSTVVVSNLGSGTATQAYQSTLDAVQTRAARLQDLDAQVLQVSMVCAANKDKTLAWMERTVGNLVGDLGTKAAAIGPRKPKPAEESTIMSEIAEAVDAVYERLASVAEDNAAMVGGSNTGSDGSGAGGDPNSTDPTTQGTSGSTTAGGSTGGGSTSGGDSGIGSMLSSLAMLPVMAIPLVSEVAKLLKPDDKGKGQNDPQHPDGQTPGGQPTTPQPAATDAPAAQQAVPSVQPPQVAGLPPASDPNAAKATPAAPDAAKPAAAPAPT